MIKKYIAKRKEMYAGIMDLEKAYDKVYIELWRMLYESGANG